MRFGFFDSARRAFAVTLAALLMACALSAPAVQAQIAPATTLPAQASANARRPIILVPGLLRSQLCRPDPSNPGKSILAWGALGALPYRLRRRRPAAHRRTPSESSFGEVHGGPSIPDVLLAKTIGLMSGHTAERSS